jgi:ketosteroid isomerase-like protein
VTQTANVELVKRLYQLMGGEDLTDLYALLADDVEVIVPGPPDIPSAGVWRGHDGMRECLETLRRE